MHVYEKWRNLKTKNTARKCFSFSGFTFPFLLFSSVQEMLMESDKRLGWVRMVGAVSIHFMYKFYVCEEKNT